jgi:hypothetical protein
MVWKCARLKLDEVASRGDDVARSLVELGPRWRTAGWTECVVNLSSE